MEIKKNEFKLCMSCMEEHEVSTIEIKEKGKFKGSEVEFIAAYEYCCNTDEYSENEEMIKKNSLAQKDAYRVKANLLTSSEIKEIRENYGVSQKEFSDILDWGMATITRYENHQIQDRAHDDILKKLKSDPNWYLEMLERAKDRIKPKTYERYQQKALEVYAQMKNQYLIDSIKAIYADHADSKASGNTQLNLNKVVEAINYLTAEVENMHKVKLMKMLWYVDVLCYKRTGESMTGLIYCAFPMGALPLGHEQIIQLENVSYDNVFYDDIAYKFKPTPGFKFEILSGSEKKIIDDVIEKIGMLSTNEIIEYMHAEDAYIYTDSKCVIDYSWAEKLSLD